MVAIQTPRKMADEKKSLAQFLWSRQAVCWSNPACRLVGVEQCGRIEEQRGNPMSKLRCVVLALALAGGSAAGLAAPPASGVAAAVASADRTPDNVKLDESRKPAQVLQFLGLRPGM